MGKNITKESDFEKDNLFQVVQNKDGEFIIWENKKYGPFNPDEGEYCTNTLRDILDTALFSFCGLGDLMIDNERKKDPYMTCYVIEALLRDAKQNLVVVVEFLEKTLGDISIQYRINEFTSSDYNIPAALVFKPKSSLIEKLTISEKKENLRAVPGDKE